MLSSMSPLAVRWAVSDLLDRRKMSTADFAEAASLSYQQALNLRRGTYERIDRGTLARVCEALKVTPGELLIIDNSET